MLAKTENTYMQKNFFSMPLFQMDINGFKIGAFPLMYGPLEPIVINFKCNFSLVCIPPHWFLLSMVLN